MYLQYQLYVDFYCQGTATPSATGSPPFLPAPVVVMPFVEQLSVANTGSGHREFGWSVRVIRASTALIARDGLELRADLDECSRTDGAQVREGCVVSLRLPKESYAGSPGFYLARSDAGFSPAAFGKLIRFYWNLTPAGAIRLMRAMTHSLNRARVPFLLKVWTNLSRASRCDAGYYTLRRVTTP